MRAAAARDAYGRPDPGAPAVEVVAVGCTPADANTLAIALRNAGIAVHAEVAADLNELVRLFDAGQRDLILIDIAAVADPAEIVDALQSSGQPVASVLLADDPAANLSLVEQLGARDIVAQADTERLALIVRREFHSVTVMRDLDEARRRLAAAEQRCDHLLGAASDAIAYVHHGMHVRANPAYARLFGFTDTTEVEDLPIMDLLAPAERKKFKGVLRDLDSGEGAANTDTVVVREGGEECPVTMTFCAAQVDGEQCSQIVVRERREEEPAGPVGTPTILPDESDFLERVDAVLTAGTSDTAPFGLLLLDIYNAGQVQKRLGLARTEAAMQELAAALQALAGQTAGICGRIGDYNLALLAPLSTAGQSLAQQGLDILAAVAESNDALKGATPEFNLAVSVADAPGTKASRLLARARETLHPLTAWRNGTAVPVPATAQVKPVDPAMVELIDNALAHDRFRLKYQPIVSLQGDTREHYSILLRLLDPNDVELSPADFLEQAAASERLVAIDRWVVKNSIRELAEQRAEGRKIVFFVTLSSAAILDHGFLLWICDCLREHQAKGAWLVFQFDVHDVIEHVEPARHLAEGLKKINCNIALDHYPRSTDAEAVLDQLPLDAVRLSSEFMVDLATSNERQAQLTDINRKLQERGLKTVATAVEDANSLAVLWNTGVNYIQGYFLQEPSNSITYAYDG